MVDNNLPPESAARGLTDVQLSALVVQGLFGRYTHKIPLPTTPGDDSLPSVLILYGMNGVGKTTVLRMLDGMISLNFDIFREIPFDSCYLEFTTGDQLLVKRGKTGLSVRFRDHEVVLSSKIGTKGPQNPDHEGLVKEFREAFFRSIENISFNFVDTDRVKANLADQVDQDQRVLFDSNIQILKGQVLQRNRQSVPRPLATKVRMFIQEAQLDSQRFFGSGEPDLFNRIMEDLSNLQESVTSIDDMKDAFALVDKRDSNHRRLGLRPDRWDYDRLRKLIDRSVSSSDSHSWTVLSTYADFLSSRSDARQLIAERLESFEDVMNDLLVDKTITVDSRRGLRIMAGDSEIGEMQLSSGEYQLLFLMIAALTTRRKGTVLAIDEPELSMHPSWQRKLVRSLVRCASGAAPQIILATHSPDVSMDYSQNMVELTRTLS